MRIRRQIIAFITLFCIFFELSEPSTNFIRNSISQIEQEQVLKIPFQVDGSGASRDQDQDHGPNLKNIETHAAQIAVSFHFEYKPINLPTYINFDTDNVRRGYVRSIFQPPKAI